jgi:predicted DNA-binding transcriptional regulator YafY
MNHSIQTLKLKYKPKLEKYKKYDKALNRILWILNRLQDKEYVKVSELAQEFDVSKRTIQRDLLKIESCGFPIISKSKGCYSPHESFSLKRASLNSDKFSAIKLLLEIAKKLGKDFYETSEKTINNLIRGEPIDYLFYIIGPKPNKNSEKKLPFLNEISQSISDNSKLEIEYKGNDNNTLKTKACPLSLVSYEGEWYLLYKKEKAETRIKLRTLPLSKLLQVKELDEYFERPKNLSKILENATSIWFNEKRNIKVILKLSNRIKKYFEFQNYFPCQKIIKQTKKFFIIETKVCEESNFMEVIPIIMRFLPDIKVLQPKELSTRIKNTIKSYLS